MLHKLYKLRGEFSHICPQSPPDETLCTPQIWHAEAQLPSTDEKINTELGLFLPLIRRLQNIGNNSILELIVAVTSFEEKIYTDDWDRL